MIENLTFSMADTKLLYIGQLRGTKVMMEIATPLLSPYRAPSVVREFDSEEKALAFFKTRFKAFGPGITRLSPFRPHIPDDYRIAEGQTSKVFGPTGIALDFQQTPPRTWLAEVAA